MKRTLALAAACLLAASLPAAAQQTESFSRKVKLGANGRVTVSNISGQIDVTAGPGDDVSIQAVKRTNGSRSDLSAVQIQVDEHPGRVDVTTNYPSASFFRMGGNGVWVDYTIVVPASAAVEARSVSGVVTIRGVTGPARAQTVSGTVTLSKVSKVESAKTVSGAIELTDMSDADSLDLDTVSGAIHGANLKARVVDVRTISGSVDLSDAACERLTSRSISGSFRLSGPLVKNGRYEIHSHSGSVNVVLPANAGFELDASSFSGAIRTAFPITIGGDVNQNINGRARPDGSRGPVMRGGPGRGGIRATIGDGSAQLSIDTFSGSIVLDKR